MKKTILIIIVLAVFFAIGYLKKDDNSAEYSKTLEDDEVTKTEYNDTFFLNSNNDMILEAYKDLQPDDVIIEVEKGQNGAGDYTMIQFDNMYYLMSHCDSDPSYSLASTLPETEENLELFYRRLHYLIRATFCCTDDLADEVVNNLKSGNMYKAKEAKPYGYYFSYDSDSSWYTTKKECPSVVHAYSLSTLGE